MAGNENTKIKYNVKMVRRALLAVMALFLIIVLAVNFKQINGDNFRRVLAKIDFGFNTRISDERTVEFTADKESKFALYKGGLAILTKDRLNVFDTTGMELTNIQVANLTPSVCANDKFIMAYDRGGNELRLYNSFAMVFQKRFDDKIISASINDNGYMVAVTQCEGYKALVTAFDSSFNVVYQWFSAENNVLCAAMSQDGSKIAVGELKTSGDDTSVCVEYFDIAKEEPERSVTLNGSFIFSLKFKDKNTVCAVTDTECDFLDAGGDIKKSYSFGNDSLASFSDENPKYTVLALGTGISRQNSKAVALDNNGKEVVNSNIAGNIKSISAKDNYIAALTDENATVINMSGKTLKQISVNSDYKLVFAVDGSHILLVTSTFAKYEKF